MGRRNSSCGPKEDFGENSPRAMPRSRTRLRRSICCPLLANNCSCSVGPATAAQGAQLIRETYARDGLDSSSAGHCDAELSGSCEGRLSRYFVYPRMIW